MYLSSVTYIYINTSVIDNYSRILEPISEPGISYDKAVENLAEAGNSVEQRDNSLVFMNDSHDENGGGDHLCTVSLTASDADPVKAVVSELKDRIDTMEERVSMLENIRDVYAAWGEENGTHIEGYSFTGDEKEDISAEESDCISKSIAGQEFGSFIASEMYSIVENELNNDFANDREESFEAEEDFENTGYYENNDLDLFSESDAD